MPQRSWANLSPKLRRPHRWRTRGLSHARQHPDGTITWTILTGTQVTDRPEPLPGYAPGEGHDAATP